MLRSVAPDRATLRPMRPCYKTWKFESVLGEPMKERRSATRKKSFLKGTVYFNNRRSSLECLIRDFSETGAHLEFAAAATLPDVVELFIPTRDETLRSHVRWRRDNSVGVSFGDEVVNEPASSTLARRVETLEHELAKLQRQFQEFRADVRHKRGED